MTGSIEIQKILDKFKNQVIKGAQQNLKKGGKNATGDLSRSISGRVKSSKRSVEITFSMEEYGTFQDQGVKGMGGSKADGTGWKNKGKGGRFQFKKGVPNKAMIQSLEKWIKVRGIKGRNKKGRFIKNKSLAFAIANSVFHTGIKRSLFFTKPFEKAFKKLPEELTDTYALEVENLLELQFQNTFKNKQKQ